jgi:carotenoid cleavage dioxygenase
MHGWGGLWHAGLAVLRRKVGVTPAGEGAGTANTALVYHANKLLALHEGDLPYAVRTFPASMAHLVMIAR